jgi:hypothetical protein
MKSLRGWNVITDAMMPLCDKKDSELDQGGHGCSMLTYRIQIGMILRTPSIVIDNENRGRRTYCAEDCSEYVE